MTIFNALLNLSELKELYSGKPVCVCPLYKGILNVSKTFEATGNPIVIPEYKKLVKLKTDFSPKQAGTGDPSPENVRPISGWDSVKLTVSNESESHDYDIALPETIYGGTVDAVTGEGEKTWGQLELNGEEESLKDVQYEDIDFIGVPCIRLSIISLISLTIVGRNSICSHANYVSGFPRLGKSDVAPRVWIYFPISDYPDESAVRNYLAAQAAAGTPVQVAYKLATPEPFKISQVSIPSLGSENKFFTNAENMDIICNITSFWG